MRVNQSKQFIIHRIVFVISGINEKQQMMIFQILSGVLHFGNVDFLEGDNDTSDIKVHDYT